MNGFKVFAVGAFLYCGPSFCHAQIRILENQADPRSILVKSGQGDRFQPAAAADLTRPRGFQAEIAANPIEDPFPGANSSPSDGPFGEEVAPMPASDPASLPVGIRHRHSPIDQILRNGLISQTPNSAQVPISWPMQGPDNPTARMLLNPGCTQGLWENYPAERAAECALMYQRLACHQRGIACGTGCAPCGQAGCGSAEYGNAHFQSLNRYAPPGCDTLSFVPATHAAPQPQPHYQRLLSTTPTSDARLAKDSVNKLPENQDNVAKMPNLIR